MAHTWSVPGRSLIKEVWIHTSLFLFCKRPAVHLQMNATVIYKNRLQTYYLTYKGDCLVGLFPKLFYFSTILSAHI
jgi:hypothetical protein